MVETNHKNTKKNRATMIYYNEPSIAYEAAQCYLETTLKFLILLILTSFLFCIPPITDETSFELERFSVRNSKKVPDQLMVCRIGDL